MSEIITESELNELMHYGTPRKSGRYPWGSGDNPNQHHVDFLSEVDSLRKQGLSETLIAEGLGLNTSQLRARKSIAKNALREADRIYIAKLRDSGMSTTAIAEQMGRNESSIRALEDETAKARQNVVMSVAEMLKNKVGPEQYLDIGVGTEKHIGVNGLGVSEDQLKKAVAVLEEQGYKKQYIKVPQLGTGKETTVKVLTLADTPYTEVSNNRDRIKLIQEYSTDGGRSFLGLLPPLNIDEKRVHVRYDEEGGTLKDGVIEVRPGVKDLSLGSSRYAQVRIAVNGTHYLKGMAMYSNDLPDGVDLVFNTNKSKEVGKLGAMKPMKDDPDNPFGSIVRQITTKDANGNDVVTSAMNIVNEEGTWRKWSKSLSSQVLSKQSPKLAKELLDEKYTSKKDEFDEIMSLTNPVVRKKLLDSFAADADSSAVHLKAASLPRQGTHVILPINSIKENEIYAPNYNNGERVVLIRYPHGGKFEIPELVVNNRQPEARSLLGRATDAVGIHAKVAERLSGADFDGDTVLVIPNDRKSIKSQAPLEKLKNFDPKITYKGYEGMKVMSDTQKQMGDISNLITDMTIIGAPNDHLARAVAHSMTVIDAEKHKLNYKQSYIDNGIGELKKKYQGGVRAGASTLVSMASSQQRVGERNPRKAKDGGPIDKDTGELVFEYTGRTYVDKNGKVTPSTFKSTKMAETKDARKLISDYDTVMENVYADHANRLKSLANQARKEYVVTPGIKRNPSAAKVYANEVNSLDAKLNLALRNAPLERQAQLVANSIVKMKRDANPDMDKEERKKLNDQALSEARRRVGAKKELINITPKEWEAIQADAISNKKLEDILRNADVDQVKQYASPREKLGLSPATLARAKRMMNADYTQAEIAAHLGISTSTLHDALA
ncbi:helix-turn-helix DNA-binding domain protein [Arthrobacter phage Arcadia]|uniref:Helix-turn-helix DNA-binding domain protein n=2 Tax=Mudcatvirus TaxID=1982088 RepID=A0A222Z6C9_9CAUD|nr:helix-turn-helix DNA-binding domain protein [Arthrobacter phage Arcadia]YP_010666186.1 helix-turn-helix DNA-binding domain protein [Arthrobacter phage Tribby]ASR80251.1 helix-turn-helix DNA-binding domain protein [Arthrobacter phage Elsa]ASR80448.1 helix-turn-helix DNA-binding domain protein [Arthrobacter phage Nason]UYL87361.1 helix-turn-helix DNA binding domain protein [Arthrobacter phage BenitoAntonio]ASR80058.1 helix-turn-helix DNA-binding domain protein [Arthrobacter phage Arcadia]ASR